jgi:flagellar operon protein
VSALLPNPALLPPTGAGSTAPIGPSQAAGTGPVRGPAFSDVLAGKTGATEPPRFSRHALERLQRRGIDLGGQTVARLASGVARAAGKGARDSVIFVDNTAFVVSVRNNTVVTAVGSEHMREHVFTNIDSAVIA